LRNLIEYTSAVMLAEEGQELEAVLGFGQVGQASGGLGGEGGCGGV